MLAITGVLGAIAVLVVPLFAKKADAPSCEQDRRNIQRAVAGYEGSTTYPPSLAVVTDDLRADGIAGNTLTRPRYTLTYTPATGAVTACSAAIAAGGSAAAPAPPAAPASTAKALRFTQCSTGVMTVEEEKSISASVETLNAAGAVVSDNPAPIIVSLTATATGGGLAGGPTPAALTIPVSSSTSSAASTVTAAKKKGETITFTAKATGVASATCTLTIVKGK